jgi:F-type H+-transporting ATPase subunit b
MAETTQSGTEHPSQEHGSGTFPPFASDTFASQIVWLAIAFGLLYLLMSRVALPQVGGILETRRGKIASDLDAAQAAKAESDAALAAYEASLEAARNRSHAIAAETRDAVQGETEATRKSLEAELATKLASAEDSIARTKSMALGSVRSIAADAAAAIVERLTGRAPDTETVRSAVDTAVRG